MSRTYRKPYQKSRRFDKTCRSNGGCPWCYGNRMHKHKKQITLKEELSMDRENITWIEKNSIAKTILTKYLEESPLGENDPLNEISMQKLRDLIILGINTGLSL